MRFSPFTTLLAAALAAPLVIGAIAEPMSSARFVQAARCAAYESLPQLASANPNVGVERMRLNAEARRQAPAIVAAARAEIRAIRFNAAAVETTALAHARAHACASSTHIV